jgi:hypothetical protein
MITTSKTDAKRFGIEFRIEINGQTQGWAPSLKAAQKWCANSGGRIIDELSGQTWFRRADQRRWRKESPAIS